MPASCIAATPLLVGVRRTTVAAESPGSYSRRRRKSYRNAGDIRLPADSELWALTSDFEDFGLRDDEFIPGTSPEECLESLRARFPGPVAELPRVQPLASPAGYVDGHWQKPPAEKFLVHARPFLPTHSRADETLEAWAEAYGPILVLAEDAKKLRDGGDFHDSRLVVGTAGTPDYALVKFNPGKAAGRATAAANLDAKVAREKEAARQEQERQRAIYTLTRARDELAGAARDDLARVDEIRAALMPGDCGTGSCRSYAWRELLALLAFHAKYFGRYAYRRLDARAAFLAACRSFAGDSAERAAALADSSYSYAYNPVAEWVDADLKARKPRARRTAMAEAATAPPPEEDDG